ncbi:hypothetical protein MW334_003526 [Vibrio parahaemolyticus]|nr:hypothetical protein [Vibrio parahaemolyticus]ELA9712801.1 hypothetical protein [Vibrio parahaemolyticus]ELA9726309.1 hypothetical protein [Vibrio parahaemolyticus]
MAINAGTVYYTVDADTQKAIDDTNKMNESLEDLSVTLAKTEQSIRKYKTGLLDAKNTISSTGVVLDEFGNVNEFATRKLQQMTVQLESARKRTAELSKTAAAVKSGISGMSGNAGQAGIQLQQFIGQIQGGQDAMLAFSQQAADIGFVLGVPLLGAVVSIAASIAGILLPNLLSSTDALEEVEKATKRVEASLTLSADGVAGYSEQMKVLAQTSEQLARIKLANIIADQANAMKVATEGMKSTVEDLQDDLFGFMGGGLDELFGATTMSGMSALQQLQSAVDSISLDGVNDGTIESLNTALNAMQDAGAGATETGRDLISTVTDLIAKYKMGEITIKDLREQLDGEALDLEKTTKSTEKAAKSAEKYADVADRLSIRTEELRSKQLELEKALTLKKAAEDGASQATLDSIATSYDKIIANEQESESEKALAKQKRETAKAEREAQKAKKQAMADDQVNANVMIKLKEDYEKNKSLLGQLDPFEGENQRFQLELDNLKKLNEAKMMENQRYLELKEQAETEHEENLQALREENFRNQSKTNAFLMDSIDEFGQASTNAISGIISGTMSASDAMRSFANTILQNAVGALVQMGVQYLKNQAISNTASKAEILNATIAGKAIAAAYSGAATLASIATMGAAAAIGGAAVATAVAANKALGLTGMAHDGIGNVPTEGTWLLNKGERVYTNDSARQLDQMYSRIMKPAYPSATSSGTATASNNQSQTANFKVEIVNQIDGAQYDTQMTADGVRVIATKVFNENIDRGVASVLGKKGTKSNKTITSKYNTRNKY